MNLELESKIGGRSPASPLTPLGHKQSRAVGTALFRDLLRRGVNPQDTIWYSSTATRASSTAQLAMEAMGLETSTLTQAADLLELDMGQWEGAVRSECYTVETLAVIEADPHNFAPPGGESQRRVEERMMSYITSTILPAMSLEKPSIIVGHGMAIKCLLRRILNSDPQMSRKIALFNTAITELGYVQEGVSGNLQPGWHILKVNDTAHLANESFS
jgi:broad specificity phosphatase PhoE